MEADGVAVVHVTVIAVTANMPWPNELVSCWLYWSDAGDFAGQTAGFLITNDGPGNSCATNVIDEPIPVYPSKKNIAIEIPSPVVDHTCNCDIHRDFLVNPWVGGPGTFMGTLTFEAVVL